MFKYIILIISLTIVILTLYEYQNHEPNKVNNYVDLKFIKSPRQERAIADTNVTNLSYHSQLSEKDEWDTREVDILARHKIKKWQKVLIDEPDIEEGHHGINNNPSLSDKELEELEKEIIYSLKLKNREDKKYEIDSNLDL